MALVDCYECGKLISTAASACPQCGAPKQAAAASSAPALTVPILPREPSETAPAKTGFSDQVRDELVAATKMGGWAILAWVIYGVFIPSVALGRNPFGVFVAFACGVVSFRAWLSRRTACVLLKRESLDGFAVNVYLPALWSYSWRSAAVFIPLSVVISALAFETMEEKGRAIGMILGIWVLPSLFILDVPFWLQRKINRMGTSHTATHAASPSPASPGGSSENRPQRMRTRTIVGVTFCIVGVLLSVTFYGLIVAPLFLVPGIVLCHLGLVAFKTHHNRTSPALVVALTLSYIALACAIPVCSVFIAGAVREHSRQQTGAYDPFASPIVEQRKTIDPFNLPESKRGGYDQFSEPFNTKGYALAAAYGAKTSPLNDGDCASLLRFTTNCTRWNRSSAPLVRDYFDPKVTAEQWVENSRKPLGELRGVVLSLQTDWQLLTDAGVKETIMPILETIESMLGYYQQLQGVIAAGDAGKEKSLMEELKSAGLRKQQLALPIAQRLRSQLGTEVADKRLQEMLSELGDLLTPK